MDKLGDSELKVMNVLWDMGGSATAAQLAARLSVEAGWHHNTTYTLIRRCIKKGAIERMEPRFGCRACISREEVQHVETSELIDKVYGGSANSLFAALLGRQRITDEQIEMLKRVVDELE